MSFSDWLHLISPPVVIFVAGGLVQQLKAFRDDFKDLKPMLREWEAMRVRVGTVESVQSRMLSDHRELRNSLGQAREKLASIHDSE